MTSKLNKKQIRNLIIVTVIILIILAIVLTIVKNNKSKPSQRSYAEVNTKVQEDKKETVLEKLYDMSEQERMSYYCGQFFKLIDFQKYEEAYNLLYDEYKENYFPTLTSFEKYCKNYFPDDMSISYENIERLGDIYVMWVYVSDTLNGSKYGHNFEANVVIQEKDYNNYVLSFSRNSAVDTMKGDE